ncbi:sugar porter family MFS transporter [Actinocatenispora rupis]|uniref:sugar porter family MFS transporter n=1 Tax=Actinocatenispora rupis TaxID=519421 RepID=UPI001944C38C|nr:sugar porter family MFS transporter [Actinocatenispora rupis]
MDEPTQRQAEPTPVVPSHTGHVLFLAIAAAVGGFLFGYDTSVINGTVDAVKSEFNVSSAVLGFVVSAALLGCAIGAWFAGPLANKTGRTRVMLFAAIIFAISAIGSAFAWDPVSLLCWRIIGGLAIGAASVIAPAYIAEIAPANLRGRLGSLQQLAIVVGIFAALLVDYVLATAAGGASKSVPWGGAAWRWMFASAFVPALVYGVLALQIPESPRYLVAKRELRAARDILMRYVGGNVDNKIAEIRRSLLSDRPVQLRDLRGPVLGLLGIVWVGILLSVFQQFVGINVIFYYSSSLWQSVGFSESSSMLTSVITSVTNIVTTLVAIALIDRIGRKPLLLIGAAGMVVTLGTMAYCFSTATVIDGKPHLPGGIGTVALVAANVYVFAFGMSWGPTVWVMLGEIFNNRIRASALAVAAAAQWIANWIISTTFPVLSGFSLTLAYGLYALFAALAFVFVARAVKETKGRELEDMA